MISALPIRLHERWSLSGICALVITVFSLSFLARYGEPDGTRLVIRVTARTSLLFFTLAFTATAMMRLFPSALTRWQARNRRYLGLVFAFSHVVHLAAIVTLATRSPDLFMSLSNRASIISGTSAYVFIALMAITSFGGPRRLIGERAWTWLHWSGGWYIWVSFVFTNGKRAVFHTFYVPFLVVLGLILAVRIAAWNAKRTKRLFGAGPAGALDAAD